MDGPLLRVRGLTVRFDTPRGPVRVPQDLDLDVPAGTTVALVGESGSGKSVTALALLRLLRNPPATIEAGSALFEGKDLLRLGERELRAVRGARLSLVFQEPMTALNPVHPVGAQIAEVLRLHGTGRREAQDRAVELLGEVGIPDPRARARAYPHELSGGMRQRALIAMAVACKPALVIADEPTTALDVSVQAQILDLFERLRSTSGSSFLFITHDLGVVAEQAKEVVVMYAAQVVESGPVADVFRTPLHPYTRGLLESLPRLGASRDPSRPRRLAAIEGVVTDLARPPAGCRFAERCALVRARAPGTSRCATEPPPLREITPGRRARCHLAEAP
ncbi:MAG: ABC transporter ATP-binding protein [Deltaproteobacteria bacterium]|nr:ABC transporter ATP-binding protein [Deltaproteobacteria bacterium]